MDTANLDEVRVPVEGAGVLFPFERMREGQRQFYEDAVTTISSGKTLLAYAPTGIGKTAAVLTAALEYALNRGMKVMFVTSRQSQHMIAIETLRRISEKVDLKVVDIINKKDMCPREEYRELPRSEFHIACAKDRKSRKCPFYRVNRLAVEEILSEVKHVEDITSSCVTYLSCPHATALKAVRDADVLVSDYNYILDAGIRNIILEKMGVDLKDVILVIDEAHSLPERVRSLYTKGLTYPMIAGAIKENKEYVHDKFLDQLLRSLYGLIPDDDTERYVEREDFVYGVELKLSEGQIEPIDYDEWLSVLDSAVETVINEVEDEFYSSSLAGLLDFFVSWRREDEHIARIENNTGVYVIPLDPSDYTEDLFLQVHSAVLMSGTLYPPEYYADLLGIYDPVTRIYESPFPKNNRLILVDDTVTTLYSKRDDAEFKKYGAKISTLADNVPGNVIAFFPSYDMIRQIQPYILTNKQVVVEDPEWSKDEKRSVVELIESSDNSLFLGVQQGSFSEGIDFKGNAIKAVIVVGLPLDPPTLEKQSLVNYFNQKFGKRKGWEYAYYIPAVNKVLQSAGRGIRSATDRCVIMLMDERFAWPKYQRYFPKQFKPLRTKNPLTFIKMFYSNV